MKYKISYTELVLQKATPLITNAEIYNLKNSCPAFNTAMLVLVPITYL